MKEKMTINDTGTGFFNDDLDHELNEVVKVEAGLTTNTQNDIQIQYISPDDIDALDDLEPAPLELSSDYWTPFEGETKKVIFIRISDALVPDFQDKNKMIPRRSVFLLERTSTGAGKQIVNSSKRLVGKIEQFSLASGAAIQVTYAGKVKNKTNNYQSDDWVIHPLTPKAK